MVEVVGPHGVEPEPAFRGRQHDLAIVVVGLGGDVQGPVEQRRLLARRLGQLGQHVHGARVEDRVDGVQPQPVDVELAHPVTRVVDEVPAHALAVGPVEVDGVAPRRAVAIGEVRTELAEVVALRAEVVVDDVQEDAEAVGMGGVDQPAQAAGAAVGRLRCVEMDAVVPPVARAGELGHRHDLDRGDAEVHQVRQVRDDGLEGPGRGEGPDVELVEDQVGQGVAAEALVGPREPAGVDDDRRAVDPLRLKPGDRIGPVPLAVQAVLIATGRGDTRHQSLEHAVVPRRERLRLAALEDHVDAAAPRRPHPERRPALLENGAEMKACAQGLHTVQ